MQVGVVGRGGVPEPAGARDLVASAAHSAGIGAVTDLVVVPRGEDELQTILDEISARVRTTNEDLNTPLPIEPGILLPESVVQVRVPDEDHITPVQRQLVDDMKATYGDALEVVRYGPEGRATTAACGSGVCDPPLRAGVRINGGEGCTSVTAAARCTRTTPRMAS